MKVGFTPKFDLNAPLDLLLIPVVQDRVLENPLSARIDRALGGIITQMSEQENFKGKAGQNLNFNTLGRIGAKRVCLLGIGERSKLSAEAYRRAGGRGADWVRKYRAAGVTVACRVPKGGRLSVGELAGALIEGLSLGLYRFDKYKSKENGEPHYPGPEEVSIFLCDARGAAVRGPLEALEAVAHRALLVAEGVITARELVNEIPEVMKPQKLAEMAVQLSTGIRGLSCRILDEREMAAEKMGAALAVGRGSENPPRFIELLYKPEGVPPDKEIFVMVGKGVTFDSGGLNLKPGESMVTMKMDMSGAAAVISAMTTIARLELPLRCAALVASVENMPSGRSYRPDDVVRAMNGITIEVGNTDAEGRLTLADALSWAIHKLGAGRIIDLATLTGACVVGLGPTTAGVFGNDRKWLSMVLEAAQEAGEKCCNLPLDQDMLDDIKSEIADVKNIGATRWGGAITAALFLQKFVKDTSWVHVDIAGPSWADKKRHYEPIGGTGYGVRTLVRLAERLAAEKIK
ncbi:MAG: hypothetical protein A3F83_14390 [Candidatus Glassbacteria bacterium RIFCSPLOWO2_12_FULL_58_11]|uniref:Probable cytosol aminopeptidase n=1 Tax=Candidatus Glassbacteria bacterium RIFCSPLOWO2_12_FULL_58_11 TaxID=1817867 RepID=A0A1F5YUK2_9BACT|nr:MAG: hypothetical protein A3F83_14390 [Candidatus Glassbacteria bacterium RIFCSPLOWO2_12_FULL_58_11]